MRLQYDALLKFLSDIPEGTLSSSRFKSVSVFPYSSDKNPDPTFNFDVDPAPGLGPDLDANFHF